MSKWSKVEEVQSWCGACRSTTNSLRELPYDNAVIGRNLRQRLLARLTEFCRGYQCPGLRAAFDALLAGKWQGPPAKEKEEPQPEDTSWLTALLNLSFYFFAFSFLLLGERVTSLDFGRLSVAGVAWIFLFWLVLVLKGRKSLFTAANRVPLLRCFVTLALVFGGTLGLSYALGGGFFGAFFVWLVVMWLGGIPLCSLDTYRW